MPANEITDTVKKPAGIEQPKRTANQAPQKPVSWKTFAVVSIILVLSFSIPLYDLIRFAARSELYSYILLIPAVSFYLIWIKRKDLPCYSEAARKPASVFLALGLLVICGYWVAMFRGVKMVADDYLAWTVFSFLLFFASACCLFLGRQILRPIMFPLSLLIFLVPLPSFLKNGLESLLQHGSAVAAHGFFKLSGTPFLQDELLFQLPGVNLKVDTACSGIHSTLVLFITSLLAGYLFLRTPWKRAALTLSVIPLALLRNGFRIFVVGELCVRVGPEMINSPIHRRGGPLFFILSLIPFFLLLLLLKRSERTKEKSDLEKKSKSNIQM